MKKMLTFLILMSVVSLTCGPLNAESAKSLNTRGFRLYKQKKID